MLLTHRPRLPFVVAVLLLVATGAGAQTLLYEHEEKPLFSIEIAPGWLVDLDFAQEARQAGIPEGEEPRFRIVEVSPGDGSHVWLGVWSLPGIATLDEGVSYFTSLRQDLFTDVEMSEPEAATIHDMEARTATGTAMREGEPVELAVALFEPRAGAIVAALYVGEPDAWRIHSASLQSMIDSLEPVTP